MKKALLLASISLFISSQTQCLLPVWIKTLFSQQEREKQAVKKALNLDMNSPHTAIVGKDAVKKEITHAHLKIFIDEVCSKDLYKKEESIGSVVTSQDSTTVTITNHTPQKYAFFVQNTAKKDQTVCDKNNYRLYLNKEELLKKAEQLEFPEFKYTYPLPKFALAKFIIYLERIAINKKIDEIKSDNSMDSKQKEELLMAALAQRDALLNH